ncbi:MAG: AAA family ATPase [Candidatus Schekmanbacteria bacterium]|nr:AAA family ATPase [Candidatus Schekmanbacteria bacterium]
MSTLSDTAAGQSLCDVFERLRLGTIEHAEPAQRWRGLAAAIDGIVAIFGIVTAADFFRREGASGERQAHLSHCLERGGTEDWRSFLIECLSSVGPRWFLPELRALLLLPNGQPSSLACLIEDFLSVKAANAAEPRTAADRSRLLAVYATSVAEELDRMTWTREAIIELRPRGAGEEGGRASEEAIAGLRYHEGWLPLHPFAVWERCPECERDHLFLLRSVSSQGLLMADVLTGHRRLNCSSPLISSLARLLLKRKFYVPAQTVLLAGMQQAPADPRIREGLLYVHQALGHRAYRHGDAERSAEQFRAALELAPRNERIAAMLALSYLRLGRPVDAVASCLRCQPTDDERSANLSEILGRGLVHLGRWAEARAAAGRLLESDPGNAWALGVLAAGYGAGGAAGERREACRADRPAAESEATPRAGGGAHLTAPAPAPPAAATAVSGEPSFWELAEDLVAAVRAAPPAPLLGRDRDIQELLDILSCAYKNNALLIGEPGVGKTALIYELARLVATGTAPSRLAAFGLVRLRAGEMVAGARYRGQFEERVVHVARTVLDRGRTILFVDDLHTVASASGPRNASLDIVTLLQPVLASPQIPVVGATTPDEYRARLQKDAALERRFQLVHVFEPSEPVAASILRSREDELARFHGVRFEPAALDTAAALPRLYLRDRYLPDKALDILDLAASRVARTAGGAPEQVAIPSVTARDVADVVAHLAAVPPERISPARDERLAVLAAELGTRIVGQDEVIGRVASVLRARLQGLGLHPHRPKGVFLFAGPTGVGKTELARAIAVLLLGDEDRMVRIDMSEFGEHIASTKLVGVSPGYVGYQDRNQLTDAVRRQPHTVVLLDEIEKASPQVLNLFLQVFDSGRLTDGRGQHTYFQHAIVIMTSNLGAELFGRHRVGYANGDGPAMLATDDSLLRSIRQGLSPEFLNRIDEILLFRPLSPADIQRILDLKLQVVVARLRQEGKELVLTDRLRGRVVHDGFDPEYGARNLERSLRRHVIEALGTARLSSAWGAATRVEVDLGHAVGLFTSAAAEAVALDVNAERLESWPGTAV